MFEPHQADIFYAEIVVATADNAETARADLEVFLKGFGAVFGPDHKMLPDGASASGAAPATHFVCARHTHRRELDAFEAEQKLRAENGKPPIPINYYLSQPFIPDGKAREFISAHEAMVLADLGLRKIV